MGLVSMVFTNFATFVSTAGIEIAKADIFDSMGLINPSYQYQLLTCQKLYNKNKTKMRKGGNGGEMGYHFNMTSTANFVSPYGFIGTVGSSSWMGVFSGYPKRAAVEEKTKFYLQQLLKEKRVGEGQPKNGLGHTLTPYFCMACRRVTVPETLFS
jgi:hypothetical protein